MGFWEKMTGKKPEQAPAPMEAEAAQPEVEPPSPELAAEAQEMKEHLSALEGLVDDPELEAKVAKLAPEARESLMQRVKDYGILCGAFIFPMSTGYTYRLAEEAAAAGNLEFGKTAIIAMFVHLGLSVASLRHIWKRSRERLPKDEE